MDTVPKIAFSKPLANLGTGDDFSDFTISCRAVMLLLNLLPLAHVGVIAAGTWLCPAGFAAKGALALGVLYLLPPILARLVLALFPIHENRSAAGNAVFLTWWAVFNLQVLFTRLPFLEELLRMIPGAYSAWLRLWGSHIGRLTYWSPGVVILDRSFLSLGNNVVLGAGVRLNPHVLSRNSQGRLELLLAPVTIGHGASIGGYSLLTSGTKIADGEATRAFLISPPFSHWREGRRINPDPAENSTHDH